MKAIEKNLIQTESDFQRQSLGLTTCLAYLAESFRKIERLYMTIRETHNPALVLEICRRLKKGETFTISSIPTQAVDFSYAFDQKTQTLIKNSVLVTITAETVNQELKELFNINNQLRTKWPLMPELYWDRQIQFYERKLGQRLGLPFSNKTYGSSEKFYNFMLELHTLLGPYNRFLCNSLENTAHILADFIHDSKGVTQELCAKIITTVWVGRDISSRNKTYTGSYVLELQPFYAYIIRRLASICWNYSVTNSTIDAMQIDDHPTMMTLTSSSSSSSSSCSASSSSSFTKQTPLSPSTDGFFSQKNVSKKKKKKKKRIKKNHWQPETFKPAPAPQLMDSSLPESTGKNFPS